MKRTLVVIHSHAAANEMVKLMWPFYKLGGCDLLGVGRTNSKSEWPEPIATENIGIDLLKTWNEHKSDSLCRKLIDTMDVCITNYPDYHNYCIIEWDQIFTSTLPEYSGLFSGLVCHRTSPMCWGDARFKSPLAFIPPWRFDRKDAECLITIGRKMIDEGDIELGTPDIFIGYAVHKAALPYSSIPVYFQCTIDRQEWRDEAREHFRKKDVISIHGIKDAETLNYITG